MNVDPGFEPRGLLTLRINVPPSRDPVALFHRIEERVLRLPGVESVASVNMLPLIATRAASSAIQRSRQSADRPERVSGGADSAR